MLLLVKTRAVFDFFSFPVFAILIKGAGLGGGGGGGGGGVGKVGFQVFAFDIVKGFLVVPLYFLTDCSLVLNCCENTFFFFLKKKSSHTLGGTYDM